MKRYWIFSGENYYPLGGMDDLHFATDSLDEIDLEKIYGDWYHILDIQTGKIVSQSRSLRFTL